MGSIGFVVRGSGGLEQSLQLLALPLLALDLVPEQGNLPSELAVGVVRLVGFGFGVANAALDDRLVDGIGFSSLFGHQTQPDKQSFDRSKHRIPFSYFFLGGSSSSSRIFFCMMNSNCEASCFSLAAATTVAPCFLTLSKTLASTSKATKCTERAAPFSPALRCSAGRTLSGLGPAVFMPSVMSSTCLRGRGDSRTA